VYWKVEIVFLVVMSYICCLLLKRSCIKFFIFFNKQGSQSLWASRAAAQLSVQGWWPKSSERRLRTISLI